MVCLCVTIHFFTATVEPLLFSTTDIMEFGTTEINKLSTNDDNYGAAKIWEQSGYYLIYFCIGCTILLIILAFFYQKMFCSGADNADFGAIIRFFSNIADFGSDILLTIVFFIIDENLFFILSLIFTAIPYLVSCIVGIYWIERWRNDTDKYLLPYLKNYDILLFV